MKIHMVKSGDTLFEIAKKYNVDLEKLIASNPQILDPNVIEVGMKVKIPNAPIPVIPPTDYLHKHVVVQGDTLWKLGKAWNVPLQTLITANPQLKNPNILMTGEIVYIPKIKPTHGAQGHGNAQQDTSEMQHPAQLGPHGKPNTAPMPMPTPMPTPMPAMPEPQAEQQEEAVMPPYTPIPMPVPMPAPMPIPEPMPTIEYEQVQITYQPYQEPMQQHMDYSFPMQPQSMMPSAPMPNYPCEDGQMGGMHSMQPMQHMHSMQPMQHMQPMQPMQHMQMPYMQHAQPDSWGAQQPSMDLFQQFEMPATEAFTYNAMQAPDPSMWGEPLSYPHVDPCIDPYAKTMPYAGFAPTEAQVYPFYQQQAPMHDCGCGGPAMSAHNQVMPYPYGTNMYTNPIQQPPEMNYIVMPSHEMPNFAQGMDAATLSSIYPGAANPMNTMGAMNPMDAMNPMNMMGAMNPMDAMNPMNMMGAMNPMDAMNPMNTMGAMNPMDAMNPMNTMGAMNPMYSMYPMNQMNPMHFQQAPYYGFPQIHGKPDCGCGCHSRTEAEVLNRKIDEEEPKAAVSKKAEKASVKSTSSHRSKPSITPKKVQSLPKSRRSSQSSNKSSSRSPWRGQIT
ncbi:LysM peptidoglycan-binding domain-containing protein [Paenibacillus agricola]|uniref:LysM peptidoglycan-binding domain-containing protein n=1 Tax=Paenibacillus agricola TaxID=2716264 RepID=UPI001FB79086|nr:LysM peptidoglycan-binding domain-containing protein [Paenibacillus agricola]